MMNIIFEIFLYWITVQRETGRMGRETKVMGLGNHIQYTRLTNNPMKRPKSTLNPTNKHCVCIQT